MKQHKLIIVIPTRNRADVLRWALHTCLTQTYGNFEVIVSDNFSEDNTAALIQELADPRVRYVNPGKRVSMSHNWEWGLSFATDGYVTVLGDDDGLLPNALSEINALLNKYPLPALTWHQSTYFWPGNPFHRHELFVRMRKSEVVLNGRENFSAVANYKKHYTSNPWLYAGFVHTDVIESVRRQSGGPFFHSMIPDVYSGLAIASQIGDYLYCTGPFSIAATSSHSNGAAQFSSNKALQGAWNTFLTEAPNIPFHASLEFISSSFAILVAESAIQVKEAGLLKDGSILPSTETILCAAIRESLLKGKSIQEKELAGIKALAGRYQIGLGKIGFPAEGVSAEKEAGRGLWGSLRKRMQGVFVDGDKAGLRNVYDASVLHHKIYNGGSRLVYNLIRKASEIVNGK